MSYFYGTTVHSFSYSQKESKYLCTEAIYNDYLNFYSLNCNNITKQYKLNIHSKIKWWFMTLVLGVIYTYYIYIFHDLFLHYFISVLTEYRGGCIIVARLLLDYAMWRVPAAKHAWHAHLSFRSSWYHPRFHGS